MSDTNAAAGAGGEPEAIELPLHGDLAFASLMDALAPEPEAPAAGAAAAPEAGAAPAGAAAPAAGTADAGGAGDAAAGSGAAGAEAPAGAGGAGQPGAGDQGAPAGDAQQPAAESGGQPGAEAGAAPAAGLPADWTADAATYVDKLGKLSTAFEETTVKAYQSKALEEVRKDHAKYFEELNKHPRLLVGAEVPAIGREGMEKLKDTADAREWQEAVKQLLGEEITSRAREEMEKSRDYMDTVHAAIELFQNNHDLVPGTKQFDRELADRFAALAKPYELRVEEKLHGYSIPVQPIIDQLREQLKAERAAKAAEAPAAAPAAPGAPAGAPAAPASTPEGEAPQAGIASKAGTSSDAEDFSTLFGTIGLPNLRI